VYSTIYFAPRKQSSQKVLGPLDGCNTMLRQSFSVSPSVSDGQTCEEKICWPEDFRQAQNALWTARMLLDIPFCRSGRPGAFMRSGNQWIEEMNLPI
jgi:hypothetical protein